MKENPLNIKAVTHLKKIIEPYSAMKIKAKPAPEYSTLNPDTSSLSPSAKSKGVRLSSAKIEINQQINKGKNKTKIIPYSLKVFKSYLITITI